MANNRNIHYGWHIVWTGTLCIMASLGLGRFAIGMLLPAMGKSLELSYSQMGLISTFNFIGYLVAVLACGFITERFGYRRVIFLALFVIGITMLSISRARDLTTIIFLYLITGMGSGAANVPMMTLVSGWFSRQKRGIATGFVVIGSGFAILLSGQLVPFLNAAGGAEGWRQSWLVLGLIVLAVSLISLAVLRNSPQDRGIKPYGFEGAGALDTHGYPIDGGITKKQIAHFGAIYFLFGYTYVIYATFIVTSLIQDRGFSENAAGTFWSWVGFLSLLSGPVFGTLSDRFGRKTILVTVFLIQTAAYLLAALKGLPVLFLYLSIGCYGMVAWSIPSVMAALVGDYAGPGKAARIFGIITFIFALGQIAGPAAAGILAEQTGNFSVSFLMAAALTLAAAFLSGLIGEKPR